MEFFVQSGGLHDIMFSLNNDYHDLWWIMKVPLHDSTHVGKGKAVQCAKRRSVTTKGRYHHARTYSCHHSREISMLVFLWICQACCGYITSDSLLFHVKSLKLILSSLITFFLVNSCLTHAEVLCTFLGVLCHFATHFVITFECSSPQVPDLIGCYRQPIKCSGAGLGIPFCTCMYMYMHVHVHGTIILLLWCHVHH